MPTEMDAGGTEFENLTAPAPGDDHHDPLALVDLCGRADLAHLITPLLRQKAPMSLVRARVSEAPELQRTCRQLGFPTLAPRLLAAGVDLETARELLNDIKVTMEGYAPTDTVFISSAHAAAARPLKPADIDTNAIYAKHNARQAAK